jgi:hypothetical protein
MTRESVQAMLKAERDESRAVQISIRLTRAEHLTLNKAAARQKVKPAALARILILSGLNDLEK